LNAPTTSKPPSRAPLGANRAGGFRIEPVGLVWLGARRRVVFIVAITAFFAGGCQKLHRVDTTPLDRAGMSYSAIQDLKSQGLTDAEVLSVANAKMDGISDPTCVELVRIAHSRRQPYNSTEMVAGLQQAGMSEPSILDLARMNQLGVAAGELQAIRLLGLPDGVVLEIAKAHAEGKPVLSGVSIANIMNTGLSRQTLLELIRRQVPDTSAAAIIAMKRQHKTDAEVLRHFPARAPAR
jgi:hypothetical protein